MYSTNRRSITRHPAGANEWISPSSETTASKNWRSRVRASAGASDAAMGQLLADPRDHLVEHLAERRGCLEPEHPPSLRHVRHAFLHVVGERLVRLVPERLVRPVHFPPDELGQLQDRGLDRGREVEILVPPCRVEQG